ncbi:MAG: hypothetical protein AAFV53_29385 [Myxococcota bacterium]
MGRHVSVAFAMVAMLWVGCAWRGPKPLQTFPKVAPSVQVVALDQEAYQLVAIQNQQVNALEDGRLQVQVELANLSSLDLDIQVQTTFRDSDGMPAGDSTPFEVLVIPGNGSKLYEVISVRTDPAMYTVQVKTP